MSTAFQTMAIDVAGDLPARMPNGARACRTCVNARKRSKR